jgi:hypothetical protein
MNSEQVFTDILQQGGGTYEVDPDGVLHRIDWDHGYVVGVCEGTAVTLRTSPVGTALPIGIIHDALLWVSANFGTTLVGAWLDDGVFYIDPVVHLKTHMTAAAVGRHFKQQAIYACSTKEVITL